jgi:hypothetical protein
MGYIILAMAAGNIYASRIAWDTPHACEQNLKPAIEYLIMAKDPHVIVRCVDLENAARFAIKSSTPFIFFPN